MKNIYLLLMVVLSTTLLQAQTEKQKPTSIWTNQNSSLGQRAFLYEFSTDMAPYVELSSPVSINKGEIWDDPDYVVTVPFPFYFMGEKIDSLGFVGTGGELFGWSFASLDNEMAAALAPFAIDLMDRGSLGNVSLSPISYQVMGSLGNQILVLEWKNAGSYNEYFDEGSLDMHISFQMWLYESDNKIIFHYGPSMIDNPDVFYFMDSGGLIGFAAINIETDDIYNIHLLEGPANNPSLTDDFALVTGTPPNGIRYIFTPDISPINTNPSPVAVQVFPNPVGDVLYLTCEEPMLEATLFSIGGVPLRQIQKNELNGAINIKDLPSGSYLLHILTQQGVHVSPIVKH